MDELTLLSKLHGSNHRQGPGSDAATRLALTLSGIDKSRRLKVADIGCGTGAQTLTLAQELTGEIVAVDLLPAFLDRLQETVSHRHLSADITPLCASMDNLPFAAEEFDLLWSEGVIYHIGFRRGIALWKPFLKPGGILAVSEISWTTLQRPRPIQDFWTQAYPEIDTASGKIKALEEAGYRVLAHFMLPQDCWMENYYTPLQASLPHFLHTYGDDPTAQAIAESTQQEITCYTENKDYYSYGFYIAQKQG